MGTEFFKQEIVAADVASDGLTAHGHRAVKRVAGIVDTPDES